MDAGHLVHTEPSIKNWEETDDSRSTLVEGVLVKAGSLIIPTNICLRVSYWASTFWRKNALLSRRDVRTWKRGGRCSIAAAENSRITRRILFQHSDYCGLRHPTALGNLSQGQTFCSQLLKLGSRDQYSWSPQVLALGASIAQTRSNALHDD
jgi:hypothetical protein